MPATSSNSASTSRRPSSSRTPNAFFWEDVKTFLDEQDVRYNPRVKLAGKSGFDHAIDFLIPGSRQAPERLIQAINSPTKSTISSYLFAISDMRGTRLRESHAYAFLNDSGDRRVGGDVIEALSTYDLTPALWSEREKYIEELAA